MFRCFNVNFRLLKNIYVPLLVSYLNYKMHGATTKIVSLVIVRNKWKTDDEKKGGRTGMAETERCRCQWLRGLKAWVCDRSSAEFADSNSTGSM